MPLVLYTALRLLLFVVVLGVGYLVGLRYWLLVVVAAVVALAVSYLALRRQRDAAAVWLAQRAERRRTAVAREVDEDAAYEDAVVDRKDDAR